MSSREIRASRKAIAARRRTDARDWAKFLEVMRKAGVTVKA